MLRKLFISISAIVLMALPAMAQRDVTFGARLGMDVSIPGGSANPYKVGSGFTVGAVANIPLTKGFFFEPGAMFFYSSMTAKDLLEFNKDYFYEGAAKFYGIHVPLNFGYSFPLADSWDMAVSTGPYVNFNIHARQSLNPNMSLPEPLPDMTVNLFKHGWKRVDAGWKINLSVTFAKCYYVGIGGGVNFTPLAKYGDKDKKIRIHRSTVSVTLGYNF